MARGWRTPEQTLFLESRIASYFSHSEQDTLKTFWETLLEEWFKCFPLAAPSEESESKQGLEKATSEVRKKRVQQIKRFFTNRSETGSGCRKNLHLQDNIRQLSEVHTYMTLFYQSRIKPTVLLRWAEKKATHPKPAAALDAAEEGEDTEISLVFKNTIAQELWDLEDEETKEDVRSHREAAHATKTVYNTEGEERLELVREYAKKNASLQHNMATVLRSIDRQCAGKGIMWVACPSPRANGKPAGYFQCFGKSPDGKDFEAHIGAEKAREIKALFADWIDTMYPSSEQHLFSFNQAAGDQMDTNEGEEACRDIPPSPSNPTRDNTSSTESDVPPATQVPPSPAYSQPMTSDSSLSTPTPPNPIGQVHVGGKVPHHHLAISPAPSHEDPTPPILPENAQESSWMKKKGTLDYLRLEEALGFLEQTPRGFPATCRPKVVDIFIKCGHKYERNYGLQVDTFGTEISAWWREIVTTAHVSYGGPTGIYMLVVLVTWWSSMLEGRPNLECHKYHAIVNELDCAILATLHSIFKTRATRAPAAASPPSSQPDSGMKRALPEVSPPRKRLRA